jgi:hypothetical protein
MKADIWLLAGGVLSAVAAALHVGCIFGGPSWYRFFGAGEGMARLAARGSLRAVLITLFIAAVLALWAAYGFSGAGLIPRLPLLRTALMLISALYLLRAAALPWFLKYARDRGLPFIYWSSAIVLVYGIVFAVGTWTAWPRLAS